MLLPCGVFVQHANSELQQHGSATLQLQCSLIMTHVLENQKQAYVCFAYVCICMIFSLHCVEANACAKMH